jgi:hypothetical protein
LLSAVRDIDTLDVFFWGGGRVRRVAHGWFFLYGADIRGPRAQPNDDNDMPTTGADAVMAAALEIDRATPLSADDLHALSSRFAQWRLARANHDVKASLKTTVGDLARGMASAPAHRPPHYRLSSDEKEERQRASVLRKAHAQRTQRERVEGRRRALANTRRAEKAMRARIDDCADSLLRMRVVSDDTPPLFVYVCGGRSRASEKDPIAFAGKYVLMRRRRNSHEDSASSAAARSSQEAAAAAAAVVYQRVNGSPIELCQYTRAFVATRSVDEPAEKDATFRPPIDAWCFVDPRTRRVLGWTRFPQTRVTKLIGRRLEYAVVRAAAPPTTIATRRILIVPVVNDNPIQADDFLCNTAKRLVDANADDSRG